MTFRVRVQPRASRDEVVGIQQGALRVRLTAPPVEGRANAALLRLLARTLDVPAASLEIRQGLSGRDKVVAVTGADVETIRARLSAAGRKPTVERS